MASESQAAIKRVLHCGDDYYSILGVEKKADDDAIKKAYRKLALRLHPDKCKDEGAEEAFKKVGEAFSVLSDAQKRHRYDEYGVDALREGGGGAGGARPEDIFEAFFGAQGPGGATFMQSGGQTFRFTTGGPGGATFMHFSTADFGGFHNLGGMGGPRQRRGNGPAREQQRAREEEEPAQPPAWVTRVQRIARALGPLLPFAIMAAFGVVLTVLGTVLQFILTRSFYVFPVLYLTEGRTKLILLAAIVVLALMGVL